jgi:hypothetical protein
MQWLMQLFCKHQRCTDQIPPDEIPWDWPAYHAVAKCLDCGKIVRKSALEVK